DHWPPELLWSGLTYTVNYYNAITDTHASTIAHAWSLGVEEQFYLVWPALFLVAAWQGRKAVGRILVVVILGVAASRSLLFLTYSASATYVYNAFDTRFDQLAVGCLLAVLASGTSADRGAALVSSRAWAPFVTMGALVISRSGMGDAWHYS